MKATKQVTPDNHRESGPMDRKLGTRVRGRRLEMSMSQERLAELIGVTFQQVQKYEKGVNRIAASRLFDIADALDISVSRLIVGLSPKDDDRTLKKGSRPSVDLDEIMATSHGVKLVQALLSMTPDEIKKASEMVSILARKDAA